MKILLFILLFLNINLFAGNIKGTVKTRDGVLPEVVVYIEKINGKSFSPPVEPAIMDQKDLTFIPHVLPILVGTTVVFPNSDVTRHSVFSPSSTKKFDFGTYSHGTKKATVFDVAGTVSLLCHVHPEMSAFILVLDTPYFAKTDDKGYYNIKNIPAGKYKITTWHEWAKPKEQVITIGENQDLNLNFFVEE